MKKIEEKTIVAIATPVGIGGIAIIRMSGEKAIEIANDLFVCKKAVKDFEPRKLYLGNVSTENFKEQCLCVVFNSPFSYTGEDVVEFQIHGGLVIANGILELLIKSGATMAEPGEFSKRAFLNGKLSLESAEGVIDMINAKTDLEVNAGFKLLNGDLSNKINTLQDSLTTTIAQIEVAFDYPEHDIEYITSQKVKQSLEIVSRETLQLINSYVKGKIIKEGVNVALLGVPNVGKSSLMNALLNYDRAIVTNIAGTTRDTLQESFIYNNVRVNIVDTAGIRESKDEVEKQGVDRSWLASKDADIVLYLIDATKEISINEQEVLSKLDKDKVIVVYNKTDIANIKSELVDSNFKNVCISAINKTNIDMLKQMIYDSVLKTDLKSNSIIITNARHKQLLTRAYDSFQNAIDSINSDMSLDLTIIDIQEAWNALGEITGKVYSNEVLNTIFTKFCLGK